MPRNIFIVIIPLMMLLTSCGGGDGVIPAPTFNTVGSYNNIPHDFTLIYDIREENASPPYRMVLSLACSGTLSYELYEDVGTSVDKTFENAVMTQDDILELYNSIISDGYFSMDALYTTTNLAIPVEVIEIYAKSTDFRVEYHPCPNDSNPPPVPGEFRKIIEKFMELASVYLENI